MALFPASATQPAARPANPWSWWTSLFALCAILGALIGLSFKTQNTIRQTRIPAANYPALVQEYLSLKRGLSKTVDDQQRTINQLNQTLTRVENNTDSDTKATRALRDDLKRAKYLAGLTPLEGPGLLITLTDSKIQIANAPPGMAMPGLANLIHDTDVNQIVNELKAAQAEAISINNQRIVANTAIRCAGPTIYINNIAQTPPYKIQAIGDAVTLEAAMNLPNGMADQLRHIDPAMIRMQQSSRVIIPAYAGATTPRYARPVAPPVARSKQRDPGPTALVVQNGKG